MYIAELEDLVETYASSGASNGFAAVAEFLARLCKLYSGVYSSCEV